MIRSKLAPQAPTSREAHHVSYVPRDENGELYTNGTWAFASVQYFCSYTCSWNAETYLLALVCRLAVNYDRAYESNSFIYRVSDGPMECIDVEQIDEQLGLSFANGKHYLVHSSSTILVDPEEGDFHLYSGRGRT